MKLWMLWMILLSLFNCFNKTDKILKVENLAELVLKEVEKRKAIFPRVLVTSSKSKIGIGEIREEIISLIN